MAFSPPQAAGTFWAGSAGGNALFERLRPSALASGEWRAQHAGEGSIGLPGQGLIFQGIYPLESCLLVLACYSNRSWIQAGETHGFGLQAGDALALNLGRLSRLRISAETGGEGVEWIIPRLWKSR